LLIVTPTAYKTGIITKLGEAEAVECDVVDLDTNEKHFSVLFFGVALRSALKPNIGNQVLGRMGLGVARAGLSAPWILEDATSNIDDIKKATDYLASGFAKETVPAPAPVAADPVPTSVPDINSPEVQALLAQLAKQPLS
jgi:hypothetical protein